MLAALNRVIRCLLASLLLCPARAGAQDSATGALEVIVRRPYDRPAIASASVRIDSARPRLVDSAGRVVFSPILPGPHRLRTRALAAVPRDTIVHVRAGQVTTVRLDLQDVTYAIMAKEMAEANAANAAAGTTDSIVEGLVQQDTGAAVPWDAFSARVLGRVIAVDNARSSTMVSAFSIGQAFAVTLLGAGGATAQEIRATLGVVVPTDTLMQRLRRFNDGVARRTDVDLRVANALWIDTYRRLTPQFSSRLAALVPGAVRQVRLASPATITAINAWADSATAGKIPQVVSTPFSDTSAFVINNAVYLKAKWLTPFDKARTLPRPFHTHDGRDVLTPMMERTAPLAYLRGRDHQVVRVPFRTGLVAMYFVLPDSGVPAGSLLARFGDTGWELPVARESGRAIQLRLPRLSLSRDIALKPVLHSLGMRSPFVAEQADFRPMLVLHPQEHAFIDNVVQKVFLELDETGAEAAAVTSVLGGVVITSAPPPPLPFFLDRPFLFLIQDERTGTKLFSGYVAAP